MLKKLSLFLSIVFIASCVPEKKAEKKDRIIIAEKNDAATLNPVAASDEMSLYLSMQIFQSLLGLDFEQQALVGILAESRPVVELANGKQWITYTLRSTAKYSDGSPLTIKDVIFSLKTNVCPLVNNVGGRNYYGGIIDSVKFYSDDSLKFSFVCNELNSRNEVVTGDFAILQESRYDSLYLLRNFTYEELMNKEGLEENDTIKQFAEQFNDQKRAFNSNYISGSGAYRLKEWVKGQRLVLEKKENWWGGSLRTENKFFEANAPMLQYEIIPDANTALSALKAKEVDFVRTISPRDYVEMSNSDSVQGISFGAQETYAYNYICYNLNNSILKDLRVRKAIAHAIPKNQIIETVFHNQAEVTHVPFPSIRKDLINDTLKGYQYNLQLSKTLLEEAGWTDTDGDGILDKDFEGQKVKLSFLFLYNSESNERKSVGLILQNELKKIGIQINLTVLEWSTYIQGIREREFDLFYGGKVSIPVPPDFSSSFHSKGANTGRNYANYQNPELDTLIEQIGKELDVVKRKDLVNQFQEIVHRDLPYVYLLTPKKHIAFSKELKNANIYGLRPNFWAPELSW